MALIASGAARLVTWARLVVDDLCVGTGLVLIGVGIHRFLPAAVWIWAGLCLVAIGLQLPTLKKRGV